VSQDSRCIAVVDDDPSVRRALGHLLRSHGFEAEAFDSAESFLEELALPEVRPPDCVLIDVQMPGMTGLELQVRLRESRPALPVMLFSAHDDPTVRERVLSAGAVAFLRKPVSEEALLESIAKALRGTGNAQPTISK
jgi:FixJ family two-component response regulator